MSLVSLREAVKQMLQDGVGADVRVDVHGGKFDLDSLKRYARQAPCVVVAVLGIRGISSDSSQLAVSLNMGAFVVVADKGQGMPRDVGSLWLTEKVLRVVRPEQDWDDEDASSPTEIRGDNLFSGQLDQAGVAIWAVTWIQPYDLTDENAEDYDDFLTCEVTIADPNTDDDELEDTITLPQTGA